MPAIFGYRESFSTAALFVRGKPAICRRSVRNAGLLAGLPFVHCPIHIDSDLLRISSFGSQISGSAGLLISLISRAIPPLSAFPIRVHLWFLQPQPRCRADADAAAVTLMAGRTPKGNGDFTNANAPEERIRLENGVKPAIGPASELMHGGRGCRPVCNLPPGPLTLREGILPALKWANDVSNLLCRRRKVVWIIVAD